ncbi:glycoside hydrolase family 76 protein [Daldinia caldariorum]|uniref:glycoside hydrolase family 76 protein n=1 Tax=Daldinia caldariorum TaxID=326644 RepID=UPI002008B344|nr:glycoside hydrolase family 76 protein [Daldinia caldariorum]KAI1464562.1 glycoside hydrolase family 76 protein [Daldinia caldariorum]
MYSLSILVGALGLLLNSVAAIDVDWSSDSSIKSAASTIAYGLVKHYTGNNTGDVPGNLPDPYYWWEAGAMFGALIDYAAFTGDTTYDDITFQALQHQVGDDADFMPKNQTKSEGNDDQGFWAMAAMTAAEMNFTNPDSDKPQWLALVQAVYNEYVGRWEPDTCGGGMRWQIYTFNNGYNYKNSVSNGCFFNIAARLAKYTGNETYAEWANKIFEWEQSVQFINDDWNVLDGAGNANDENCTEINGAQFTYNAGLFLYGTAAMYNHTNGAEPWKTRLEGQAKSVASIFFQDGILWEPSCEKTPAKCDTDQQVFKGHLSRWMALTSIIAPFTAETFTPLLKTSAQAAAKACTGPASSDYKGPDGTACGFSWLDSSFDGITGVGEQMNAMQAVMAPLAHLAQAPYTSENGGSSQGNPNAGAQDSSKIEQPRTITTGDKAGAGILTALALGGLMSGMWFVLMDEK